MNTCLKKGIDHALLETCFGDNVEDMTIYQSNKSAIAKAIADGIISAFGLTLSNNTAAAAAKKGTVANCSVLNVRSTPNGKIKTTIKKGTSVDIDGNGKDSDGDVWYKVSTTKGVEGYVWPKYISLNN